MFEGAAVGRAARRTVERVNKYTDARQFRHFAQHLRGQHAQVLADARQQLPQHRPVQQPERMVSNGDDAARRRDLFKVSITYLHFNRKFAEEFTRKLTPGTRGLVKLLQFIDLQNTIYRSRQRTRQPT